MLEKALVNAAVAKGLWSVSEVFAGRGAASLIKPSPGVTVRQVGNYWIKEVDAKAPRLAQWYGRRSLYYQDKALTKLGDMAPSHLYRNGRLITRDAGPYTSGSFWRTWWEGSRRLGTPMNDIRPRNIGANGSIFDPAWDPIARGAAWTGVALTPPAGYFVYSWATE